jgi:hypothetical protein
MTDALSIIAVVIIIIGILKMNTADTKQYLPWEDELWK